MKKIIIGVLALSLGFTASAQGNKKEDRKEQKIERKEHFGQRHFGDGGVKKLNLSTDQQTRLKSANETFRDKMKELNKQENITVKEQKERRATLVAEHKASVETILTAEQKQQLETQKKDAVKGRGKTRDRMAQLDKTLNLTDAQGQKIKEVNTDYRTKLQEVQHNESLTKEQKREQLKTLQQTHTEQIKSVLTEEQKTKLEALRRTRPDRKTGK